MNRFPSTDNGNILDLILCNFPEKIANVHAFEDVLDTDHAILSFDIHYPHAKHSLRSNELMQIV